MSNPRFSIIVPAYNSAGTLGRALKSLAAQTRNDWEAIVVNDGSQDNTQQVTQEWAARDRRVRIINQRQSGASTARNNGIKAAVGEWIVCLDADDTLDRRYLAIMSEAAERHPSAGAVCCGYRRRGLGGRRTAIYAAPPMDQDAFLTCAGGPPTAIHAIMVKRFILQQVGLFDPALTTNEDWDLWLRVARAGTEFAVVRKPLAQYWNSNDSSLTKNGPQMLRDAFIVMRRVRCADPRVPNPLPQYAAGAALGDPLIGLFSCAIWNAAAVIGAGRDGTLLLEEVESAPILSGAAIGMTSWLLDGLMLGAHCRLGDLINLWPRLQEGTRSFLHAVALKMQNASLEQDLLRALEVELLTLGNFRAHVELGSAQGVILTPDMLWHGFSPPKQMDAVVFRLFLWPRSLFRIPIVVFGPLSGKELRGLVARRVIRKLSTKLLTHERSKYCATRAWRAAIVLRRKARKLLGWQASQTLPLYATPVPSSFQPQIDLCRQRAVAPKVEMHRRTSLAAAEPSPVGDRARDLYAEWDEFFATEDPWHYDSAYERLKYGRTLSLLPDVKIGRAIELACAEGHFTITLAPRVEHLVAVDISSKALARARHRGRHLGNIEYRCSDFFAESIAGPWDLIVCSEVLYYMEAAENLQAFVERVANALSDGGYFLHAHAYEVTDDPSRTGFDWNDPLAATTILNAFESHPRLHRVRTITTDLYRIDLFEKAVSALPPEIRELPLETDLELPVARSIVWNGAIRTRPQVLAEERKYSIPVLMYHRISAEGPEDLAAYRVAPPDLEHQLRFLRRRGFRSITTDEWMEAAGQRGSLRGRPVILTFDDAYLDFYETAWPLIARNGFSAHVFVPTAKVGGTSDWDSAYGAPAPLMNWQQIGQLAAEGVTFGSHLRSHTAADLMSSADLLDEAVGSRAVLEAVTAQQVHTVAPPFGAIDARTEQILGMAGYTQMFSDRGTAAPVARTSLYTPRIAISGLDSIEAFAAKLGMLAEPPGPADKP